jgi:signal peptidase I
MEPKDVPGLPPEPDGLAGPGGNTPQDPPSAPQAAEGAAIPTSPSAGGPVLPIEGPPPAIEGAAAPTNEPSPRKSSRARSSIVEACAVVLLALLLALILKVYVAEAYEIHGRSMMDTFHEEERVMLLKVFYEIHRGDIIIFSSSENPQKDLIKRVIGLPGDVVEIDRSDVYVNGVKLKEPYAVRNNKDDHDRIVLGPGKYYVLGDNRPDSQDSRSFHAVDAASIKGRVILRWWPLERLGSF